MARNGFCNPMGFEKQETYRKALFLICLLTYFDDPSCIEPVFSIHTRQNRAKINAI
jgi:hypothetical protein